MAGGGVLQFTLLVTAVLCYLIAITNGSHLTKNTLVHIGRNLLPCSKKPMNIDREERFLKNNPK